MVFCLTRFAERFSPEVPVLTPAVVRERLELLKRTAAAAVSNQTVPLDGWLLSVSSELGDGLLQEIGKAVEGIGTIVIQKKGQHSAKVFATELRRKKAPYLTFRLDSDDAISIDFVQRLLEAQIPAGSAVSFSRGTIFDLNSRRAAKSSVRTNPFLAYRGTAGRNVFDLGQHGLVEETLGRRFLSLETGQPMWCTFIHGSNVANKMPLMYAPEPKTRFHKAFPFLPFQPRPSFHPRNVVALSLLLLSGARKMARKYIFWQPEQPGRKSALRLRVTKK